MTRSPESQPWTSLPPSVLGSLNSLWAQAYNNRTVSVKAVTSAPALDASSAGSLDDLWAETYAGLKHRVAAKVVTDAKSEAIRQGRATLKYAVIYQYILLGFVAALALRNVFLWMQKRYRLYELHQEAKAQEKIDKRRSLWSIRTGRPDLADEEIKVNAWIGTFEQVVYFPLGEKWYWLKMENPLQVFLFVVALALNATFILLVDTNFRIAQTSAWNKIHVVALRCGFMSMAQLPAVFALTGRNNLVQALTGIEYQHTRWAHKLLACWFGLLGLIHTIDATVAAAVWQGGDSVKTLYTKNSLGITGLVMIAGTVLLGIFSLRRIRMRWYELFLFTHILGALMITAALIAHVPDLRIWVIVPLAFWALERVLRWVQLVSIQLLVRLQWRSPFVKAHATLIEGAVVLRVPYKGKWYPGQHAYISLADARFLKTPWLFFQSHPFSIANVASQSEADLVIDPTGKTNEMEFVMRIRDGMTKTLADHLSASHTASFPVWITVEGPYAHSPDIEQFNSLLLVGGGSGITHLMSILGDSIFKATSRYSRAKRVRLVWTIQTIEQSIWTLTQLLQLTQKAAAVGVDMSLEIYVTRGVWVPDPPAKTAHEVSFSRTNSVDSELTKIGLDPEKELGLGIGLRKSPAQQDLADFDDALEESGMEGQIQILGGRPPIHDLVTEFVMTAKGKSLVTVCGPSQLAGGVRKAVLPLLPQYPVHLDVALFEC